MTRPYVARARGARHPARAGRRQVVPRSRGDRDASRRARRDRVARRRAVGVRDAARRAVRRRRRGAARVEAALRSLPPVPDSGRSPAADLGRSGTWQPIADACACSQHLHRRRNYRPVAETIQDLLDATRAHVGFVLRSAGEQALANVLHVAELARAVRGGRRPLVPRLRRRAARRRRARAGRRGADPRGRQRRRPHDDRAQGEGARVPDRDPRRHDVQAVARRGRTLARSRSATCAR